MTNHYPLTTNHILSEQSSLQGKNAMRRNSLNSLVGFLLLALLCSRDLSAGDVAIRIQTPMTPPGWALLERELLRANHAACQEFFAKYFDERGYLMCVERWGGDDGPDDAIENLLNWTTLHALGGPDEILDLFRLGFEGHVRQYTEAKTVEVEMGR